MHLPGPCLVEFPFLVARSMTLTAPSDPHHEVLPAFHKAGTFSRCVPILLRPIGRAQAADAKQQGKKAALHSPYVQDIFILRFCSGQAFFHQAPTLWIQWIQSSVSCAIGKEPYACKAEAVSLAVGVPSAKASLEDQR